MIAWVCGAYLEQYDIVLTSDLAANTGIFRVYTVYSTWVIGTVN